MSRGRGRGNSDGASANPSAVRRPEPAQNGHLQEIRTEGSNSVRSLGSADSRRVITRPAQFNKTGSDGQAMELVSNYFQVLKRTDMVLLKYHVDFSPDVEHIGLRKVLVRNHRETLGKYIFRGTLLYGVVRLAQPLDLFSIRNSDNVNIRISFRLVGELHKEDAEYSQVMSDLLRTCLEKLDLTEIRRNFFDSNAASNISIQGNDLTIWPGYFTSIHHHENDFLLGVEIQHKVLRQQTALNVMELIRRGGVDNIDLRVRAELEGQIVMTMYNKKTYRIDDIDFSKNPESMFTLKNGQVSYRQYFFDRYQKKVQNSSQPLLVSRPSRRDINRGNTEPIFLIPELCAMTGLSEDQRKNFTLMKEVKAVTMVDPDRRVQQILKFRARLQNNPEIQAELASWGMHFSKELVTCKGRVVPACQVQRGNEQFVTPPNGDFSNNIKRNKMCVVAKLLNWIVFYPVSLAQPATLFVKEMQRVGSAQNFLMPDPIYVSLQDDQDHNYVAAIKDKCSTKGYSLVLCFVKGNRLCTYSALKKLLCETLGIPSQIVRDAILMKQGQLTSIATKVMVQIAAKLGAEPWRIGNLPTKWMVMGFDTYHDARQRRAVGALVASTNDSFTRFHSAVKIHENNEEISPNFRGLVIDALKAYYKNNKCAPVKIIVYRDGVGAGDIARVLETEVVAVKSAIQEMVRVCSLPSPIPLAFIIVTKRINTRFFLKGVQPAFVNPRCGTVCDNTVTSSHLYDFFLISQHTTQGTAQPVHYNVIHDNSGVSPNNQQRLAHSLTHLYYNWPGTLRVPAPLQYAHKLAYLVGETGMGQPAEQLAKFPYYL